MRQIIAAAALALAVATPAFVAPALAQTTNPYGNQLSPDSEVRAVQEWHRTVAKANAERLDEQAQNGTATQLAAVRNSASATDAAVGSPAASQSYGAGYGVGLGALGGCPGTDAAGGTWHPGEYCLPGGR